VAINVHGSEDQVKDASSADRERHVSVFLATGACASKSACGRRSLPRRPLDIRCRRCVTERGGDPFPMPDRTKIRIPTLTREGQRHPANRDAFHRCARVRRSSVGLLHRTNPARRSLAHAAHTFSTSCGEVPSRALQAPECGHPRSLAIRGTSAFGTDGIDSFESLVPGTDDPSAPFGSTVVARLRELIALLVPTPDAAPLRLLRPRARGPMCRELHERVYA
jgi:hypothetical protein